MATDTTESFNQKIGAGSAAEVVPYINLLVYGDPGVGKTELGGTAQDHPSTSPVLILDIEGGTATLRKRPDVMVVRIKSVTDLVLIHGELDKAIASGDPQAPRTVVVDSLTELQKLDMNDIMRTVVKRAKEKGDERDPDVPSQREWGKSSNHIRNIVRAYRDLPCNVIFTALAKREQDDNTGTVVTVPSLPGKLASETPAFLDIVGYLYTEIKDSKIQRRMLCQPSRTKLAKDRLGVFGDLLENPTIPMLWDMMHESESL
jgi:phage nucleotide-binding protein